MTDYAFQHFFSSAVRSIPPKSKGNRGFFPSKKVNNGIVEYESQIERDFYILLDHSDDVDVYQHQPVKIDYVDGEGKKRSYTPDVFIRFANKTEAIVEIKSYEDFQDNQEQYSERWEACYQWCKERSIQFIILTEKEIRSARFANVWFTLGSSKVKSNDNYMEKLLRLLPKDGIEFNHLCHISTELFNISANKASQIVCYAIYHGLVHVNLFSSKIMTSKTIIKPWKDFTTSPFNSLLLDLEDGIIQRETDPIANNSDLVETTLSIEGSIFLDDNSISRKEKVVKSFLQTPSKRRTREWRTQFEKQFDVPISTVYSWVRQYKSTGKLGLRDKYYNSGRDPSWDDETYETMEKARRAYLDDHYTIKRAYEEFLIENWRHKSDPPSYSTFWRYVNKSTSYYEKEISLRGSKHHKTLQPSLSTFQGAIMPMQVLQFDNTPFDLFVKGLNQESIGTPNLCAAIDVYTRMITGFELTLNTINRQSILETLVQSILPKDQYISSVFSNTDYRPEWDISGYPVLILVDNGMDYRSNDVKRFCMEFDIILEFAPLSTPRFKAYIESWFNTLKDGIRHELQGEGFRPKLIERLMNPDLDPEENVIFSNQQSERWLTSWILDSYHLTNPYKDGLEAPKLRYRNFVNGYNPIILPKPRDPPRNETEYNDLIINGLVSTERVLKNNIEFMNLKYSSPELIQLFKELGKIKVTVLYDVRDIRSIWIINPVTHKPLSLQLTNGWANAFIRSYEDMPVSLSFWKREVSMIKNANRKKLSLTIFRKERGSEYRSKLRDEAKNIGKRETKKIAAIEENKRKLDRKPIFHQKKETSKSIIEVKENGEFVRKYVPLPKSLQAKVTPKDDKTNQT